MGRVKAAVSAQRTSTRITTVDASPKTTAPAPTVAKCLVQDRVSKPAAKHGA